MPYLNPSTRLRGLMLALLLCFVVSCQAGATTYATWIMVWYGHDQGWWKSGNTDASKDLINGQWKTLDWSDTSQYSAQLDGIKAAGVTVVIADLTNGWKWLDARCKLLQELCAQKGMKFCVAENSTGNTTTFESHAKDIWDNFAGQDAANHETYFQYHGKPLIVCYGIREWIKSYTNSTTLYRSRFNLVWSSGEDSNADKWGWQLEPWVGSIPSKDSMFVTSAVKWNSTDTTMWRKSLAWLDYNFAAAKKANPEYVVVGAYDDPTERNGWLVSDTTACEPGRQMRDKTGAISTTAHYERVKQWISGKPTMEPGGVLRDGAYRLVNRATSATLGFDKSGKPAEGAAGAVCTAGVPEKAPRSTFWIYHLGRNHYRIIALQSGLALESNDAGKVLQNWDSTDPKQRWILAKTPDGFFQIRAELGGRALTAGKMVGTSPAEVALKQAGADRAQQWRFEPVATL